MTFITPASLSIPQPEPAITVAIHTNKLTLKNRGIIRDYGTVLSIPPSQFNPSNKSLFERFVIIYCPLSQINALPQALKLQGWGVFLKAHSYLLARDQINTDITSEKDYKQHMRKVNDFYESCQTLIADYPRSPLIPIVHFQLGIYNQYFLRNVLPGTSLTRAYLAYKTAADLEYSPAQYKLGKILYKGLISGAEKQNGLQYFLKASTQNHAQSQYMIGTLYEDDKKYCDAFLYYNNAAEQNHAKALFKLGALYANALGVKQDPQKALESYEKAANLGHAYATYRAALYYDKGIGTQIDHAKALNLFTRASEKKVIEATYKLGEYAEFGLAGPANIQRAVQYYEQCANLNYPQACYKIGVVYQAGVTKKVNLEMALLYYQKAVQNPHGHALAEYSLGEFAENGYIGKPDLKEAIRYYQTSATKNYAQAQYKLGLLYEAGTISANSDVNAFIFFERAAVQNHHPARYKIAMYYLNGIGGITKDEAKGRIHLMRATEGQYPPALYKMAELSEEKELDLAISYYKRAADGGYPPALCKMGDFENRGLVKIENADQISPYYLKAAERGHPEALYQVGLCHETGTRTKIDIKQAVKFYQLAANQHHPIALDKLKVLNPILYLNKEDKVPSAPRTETASITPDLRVVLLNEKPPAFTGWRVTSLRPQQQQTFYVKPADIMANDNLFLPLGTYPRPEECSQTLLDQLHTEEHRTIMSHSAKRQKIQNF